jgi:hypothetical protein
LLFDPPLFAVELGALPFVLVELLLLFEVVVGRLVLVVVVLRVVLVRDSEFLRFVLPLVADLFRLVEPFRVLLELGLLAADLDTWFALAEDREASCLVIFLLPRL